MNIKWIVTDMDGTLLNKEEKISEKTRDVLMQCQQKGIKIILASGRGYRRLFQYGEALELAKYHGYFIEFNGMAITDCHTNEKTIFRKFQREEIQKIFLFLKTLGVEIQGYVDDGVYDYIPAPMRELKRQYRMEHHLPEDYPWTGGDQNPVADARDGYPHIRYIASEQELPDILNKMVVNHAAADMAPIEALVKETLGKDFEVTRTTSRLLEITPKGITKGNALQTLMEQHQVSPEEVVVFGDGENDISMLGLVRYSVATANAVATVKDVVWQVTDSHDDDGVANFLIQHGIGLQ